MRIGEVAEAVGVPTATIRFYERKGLLPQPHRGPNGYREYDDSTLTTLAFIRNAQAAGLTLVEIATILELTESRVSQIRTKALGRLRTEMRSLRAEVA